MKSKMLVTLLIAGLLSVGSVLADPSEQIKLVGNGDSRISIDFVRGQKPANCYSNNCPAQLTAEARITVEFPWTACADPIMFAVLDHSNYWLRSVALKNVRDEENNICRYTAELPALPIANINCGRFGCQWQGNAFELKLRKGTHWMTKPSCEDDSFSVNF